MREAINDRIQVLVLSGDAGSGKTTLVQAVVSELSEDCLVVNFTDHVASFEDVIKNVASAVGCETIDVSREGKIQTIIEIGERLSASGKRVVALFDSAEQIYLATLERIRKMLEQLNSEEVRMQVLLCGRPLVLENLRQLAIVKFDEVPEKRYELTSLDLEDSLALIEYLANQSGNRDIDLFSLAAVKQAHLATEGNIAKLADLVSRSLNSMDPEQSLTLLARDAGGEKKEGGENWISNWQRYLDPRNFSRKHLGIAGAGICTGLVLLLLFSGKEEVEEIPEKPFPPAENFEKVEMAETAMPVKVQVEEVPDQIQDSEPDRAAELSSVNEREKEEVVVEPVELVEDPGEFVEPVAPDPSLKQVVAAETVVEEPVAEPVGDSQVEEPADSPAADIEDVVSEVVPQPDREATEVAEGVSEAEVLAEQLSRKAVAVAAGVALTETKAEDEPQSASEQPVPGAVTDLPPDPPTQIASAEPTQVDDDNGGISAADSPQVASRGDQENEEDQPVGPSQVPDDLPESEREIVVQEEGVQPLEESSIPLLVPANIKRRFDEVAGEELTQAPGDLPVDADIPLIESAAEKKKYETVQVIQKREINPPVQEREELTVQAPPAPQKVPEISADQDDRKIKIPVVEPVVVPDTAMVQPKITSSPQLKGEQLTARLAAGQSWLRGEKDDRYTLQVMVLKSADAESRVKRLLATQTTGDEEDFYVFRDKSFPPAYYVYYGEYSDMTEARQARNSIPNSLRGYRPYVLSVKGAVSKVNQN